MDFDLTYCLQTIILYGTQSAVQNSYYKTAWNELSERLNVDLDNVPFAVVGFEKKAVDAIWEGMKNVPVLNTIKYALAVCDLISYAIKEHPGEYPKLQKLHKKNFGNINALNDSNQFIQDCNAMNFIIGSENENVYLLDDGSLCIPSYLTDDAVECILTYAKIALVGEDYRTLILHAFLTAYQLTECLESDWFNNTAMRVNLATCASLIDTHLQSVIKLEINPEKIIKYNCISTYVDPSHRILAYKDPESGKITQELYKTNTLLDLVNSGAFEHLDNVDGTLLFDGKSYKVG